MWILPWLRRKPEIVREYHFESIKTEIAKLEINPGDIIVIFLKHSISSEAQEALRKSVREYLSPDIKVVIFEESSQLAVIKCDKC
jgi:hypothetical protein